MPVVGSPFILFPASSGDLPSANKIVQYQPGVGVTDISGEMSAWADQSGNAHTLNDNGSSRRPDIITNGGPDGTKDSYRYNGTTDGMSTGAFTWVQPSTIYIVFKPITWTVNKIIIAGQNSDIDLISQGLTPEYEFAAPSATAENLGISLGDWHVLAWVQNGSSSKYLLDDGSIITINPGTNGMDGLRVGRKGGGYENNVEISDIVGYDVAHDDATLASAVQFFQDLYGL